MRRIDYSWVILSTGFVVLFFGGGSRFVFGLMLKPMADDMGWSRSSLSGAVTLFMVVSALAMPVVGRLVDRYSLRWTMAAGVLLAAAGIGLTGRVTAIWQVFVIYGVLYAVGNAAGSTGPVGVMVSRWFVRRRGIANSAAISGNALGQLVIIALLTSLLTTLGWRMSFAVLAAANLAIVAPLVLATVRPRPPGPPNGEDTVKGYAGHGGREQQQVTTDGAASLREILASRQLRLLLLVYAVCGIQDFFVATHVVAFALDEGVGPILAGNILALMGLVGLLGVLSSGLLSDAFGPSRPTAICFLMRIGIFAFIINFRDTPSIVAFALLYGFTFLITAPLTVVFASNIFGPARLGTVSGLISMVHQIAGGLGALVGAIIFDRWHSYDPAFVLMLGLAVVGTATMLLVRDKTMVQAAARP